MKSDIYFDTNDKPSANDNDQKYYEKYCEKY